MIISFMKLQYLQRSIDIHHIQEITLTAGSILKILANCI